MAYGERIIPMSVVHKCDSYEIGNAATALLKGALVSFPTETVYGLGADATNQLAVNRIFAVKGRPSDHPLIVHISSIELLRNWVAHIPKYALRLAESYWPGPMTLILPSSKMEMNHLTGGQQNIAIRIPSHPIALLLLKEFESRGGIGVAAPSANKYGAVSPTTAHAVENEIGFELSHTDLILDGGQSSVGIESTIINCLQSAPSILRPGAVTKNMIEQTLNIVIPEFSEFRNIQKISAPGLKESHYSPKARIYLSGEPSEGDGYIALAQFHTPKGVVRLASPRDNLEFARELYKAFRLADKINIKNVYVIPAIGNDIAVGINDRLYRASRTGDKLK
jgi:L-threonylcarbamoyladenylate synthase